MAKKAKIPVEERLAVERFKLIFSTLTARSCQYAYIFPRREQFILSNSTTTRPPNELKKNLIVDHEFHGDRAMNFMDGDLGVHLVEVKEPQFMQLLRGILGLDALDKDAATQHPIYQTSTIQINPVDAVWAIITSNFLSLVSKYPVRDLRLEIVVGMYNDLYIYLLPFQKHREKKNLVAFNIINYHYEQILYQYLDKLPQLWKNVTSHKYPCIHHEVDIKPVLIGKSYFEVIDFQEFINLDGTPVFQDGQGPHKLMAIDGLNTVSLKEFLKKLQPGTYEFDQYFWVSDSLRVLSMTRFCNNVVEVLSTRPNIQLTPLPAWVKFIPKEQLPTPEFQ